MSREQTRNGLSEERRNDLLRSVDWRFLLRQAERPRTLDLTASKRYSEALRLVGEEAGADPGAADLVVLGFPTRRGLRRARAALRPGGEVVCIWRLPRLAGVQRARARLRRAGLEGASFYWPGPRPFGKPDFWLPLGAPGAAEHLLSQRPAGGRPQVALRSLWRLLARIGTLAPVCAIARRDGSEPAGDEIARLIPSPEPWVLLTTGTESMSKVVGLPFCGADSTPGVVVKVARDADSDASVEQEADVLRSLARHRPDLDGVPALRARGRRSGRRANVQEAVYGQPLSHLLTAESLAQLAPRVTDWLIALAGEGDTLTATEKRELTVGRVEEFERQFASSLTPGAVGRMRRLLDELDELPAAVEHRDFAPWNVVLTPADGIGVLDWETASLRGLPAVDLAFFLGTAAVLVENPPEPASAGPHPTIACQWRLLDPATEMGVIAAACIESYCGAVGIEPEAFARLRLLSWIVQALAYRGLESEDGAADASWFNAWAFAAAAEDEARRLTTGSGKAASK